MAKKGGEGNTGGGCTRVPKKRWQKRGDKKEVAEKRLQEKGGERNSGGCCTGVPKKRWQKRGDTKRGRRKEVTKKRLGHFRKMGALGACRYFRILWGAWRVWTLSENARTGYFSTFSDFTARCARLDASGKCAHWALVENSDFMARCARLDTFGKCAHWALVDEVRKRM